MIFAGVVAVVLPTAMDAGSGLWLNSWAGWGTIRPHAGSPGLLFSIPLFLGTAFAFRLAFNWHTR